MIQCVLGSCTVCQRFVEAGGGGDSHAPTCMRGRSSFANKRIERTGKTARAWDVTLNPSGNKTHTASHVNFFLLPFIWRLWWKSFIAPKKWSSLQGQQGAPKKKKKSLENPRVYSSFLVAALSSSNQTVSSRSIADAKGQLQVQPGQGAGLCDKAAAAQHKMRIQNHLWGNTEKTWRGPYRWRNVEIKWLHNDLLCGRREFLSRV